MELKEMKPISQRKFNEYLTTNLLLGDYFTRIEGRLCRKILLQNGQVLVAMPDGKFYIKEKKKGGR